MQKSAPPVESRSRFVAKALAAYLGFGALCAAFIWYFLDHDPGTGWMIGCLALIFLLGVFLWRWSLRTQVQRNSAQTRAFYSKLFAEVAEARTKAAVGATASDETASGSVTVGMGMYTVPQTVGLALMALYRTPRSAVTLVILSLCVSGGLLVQGWPPSVPRLVLVVAGAIAFNVVFVGVVAAGMRPMFKKVWRDKGEAAVTISGRGLEMRERGESGPTIPWTSIDRVIETRFWILFMRGGRRVVAIPGSRVSRESLELLREILRAAKGDQADLRTR